MHKGQLGNCSICGMLFNKSYSDHCLDCHKELEEDFQQVADFLKNEHYRGATIAEVSEATEVSKKRIKEFIRSGRLYTAQHPNLSYPCTHCAKMIKKEDLCTDCAKKFSEELNKSLQADKFIEKLNNSKVNTSVENQYWKLRR